MRRAELRLESYLADQRGDWVTMAQIKRRCGLDWEEAGHVWNTALPHLVRGGLLNTRPRPGGTALQFSPTPRMVAGVAQLQWSRLAPTPVTAGR